MLKVDPNSLDLRRLSYVALNNLPGLPNTSGVYFVLDNAFIPQYIGRAIDLRRRLISHNLKDIFLEIACGRLAWLLVPREQLATLETIFIAFYAPPLNKSKGGGHVPMREEESLTVRFPRGMLDAMRKAAEQHDRSLNAEIVRAVRVWLQRQDTANDPDASYAALTTASP